MQKDTEAVDAKSQKPLRIQLSKSPREETKKEHKDMKYPVPEIFHSHAHSWKEKKRSPIISCLHIFV